MILVNLKLKQLQSNLVSHTSHTFIVFKLQKISTVLRDDRFCYFQIFFWCKVARILRGGGFLDFFALYKCVCVCKCSFVLFNPLWATYNKTKQNVSLHYLVFRRFYVHKWVSSFEKAYFANIHLFPLSVQSIYPSKRSHHAPSCKHW